MNLLTAANNAPGETVQAMCRACEKGYIGVELADLAMAHAQSVDEMRNFGFLLPERSAFTWEAGNPVACLNGNITEPVVDEVDKWLASVDKKEEKFLRVHSPGGNALTGVALANELTSDGNVTAIITGLAYSAASIMVQGAKRRVILPGGMIGIHRAWVSITGNAKRLTDAANRLKILDNAILRLYAGRTKMNVGKLEEMVAADTVLEGLEAVKCNFVDDFASESPDKGLKLPHGSPVAKPTGTVASNDPAVPETPPRINQAGAATARNEAEPEATPPAAEPEARVPADDAGTTEETPAPTEPPATPGTAEVSEPAPEAEIPADAEPEAEPADEGEPEPEKEPAEASGQEAEVTEAQAEAPAEVTTARSQANPNQVDSLFFSGI